jgi:hypothetical protein
MILDNHLIYIDITQLCGIGCDFCMYSDKHTIKQDLNLNKLGEKNISGLINHPEVKRVTVSGEGEPLNRIHIFKQILKLSKGGIAFEFISSGFLLQRKLIEFYDKVNEIVTSNGDTCNIRLSCDSYHIAKIKSKPHGASIKYFFEKRPQGLTFSFRSIDTDKEFTRNYLKEQLLAYGYDSELETVDVLEDHLLSGDSIFKIEYKSLVKPTSVKAGEYMDLGQYIAAKENRIKKSFTLGSLNGEGLPNGMDITIKPSGEIFFYGIESLNLANILKDDVDIEFFKNIIRDNKMVNTLYSKPFMEVMGNLNSDDSVKKLIRQTNNPYWIIKELNAFDENLLNKIS